MSWELVGSELSKDASGTSAKFDEINAAMLAGEVPEYLVSRRSRKAATVRIRATGSGLDDLTLAVEAVFGAHVAAIRPGQDHVVLNTAVHPLHAAAVDTAYGALDEAGITTGHMTLGMYQELVVRLSDRAAFVDDVQIDPTREAERAADYTSPARISNATLYPYQVAGSAFIRAMASQDVGTLVADEMGLGKTLQVITLLAERRGSGLCLVVAPAALLLNWSRELERFAPDLSWLVHVGPDRPGVVSAFSGIDVVITSYETLTNDMVFMGDADWDVVVLDEAQAIKNPESQRAAAVKALRRRVGLAVTGTPIENGLTDIWSIVEFVVPSIAGTHAGSVVGRERDLDEAERTGRAVAPVILRRRVSEVGAQLPERVDDLLAFPLGPEWRSRYDAIEATMGPGLASIQAQRQFCALADPDQTEDEIAHDAKMSHLVSEVESLIEMGEKALIFASFTLTIDRLVGRLTDLPGIAAVAAVDGRTGPAERQRLIDEFGKIQGAAALVMNPKAAGVGLNITAANHVFHFNPEWNPAATDQANARAHRTGQTRTVFVHEFYYADTVEENAVNKAELKRTVADAVEIGVRAVEESTKAGGTGR